MCGIVAYIGPKEAIPVLVSGLKKLEYRGYDSAGVSTISSGEIKTFRAKGKLKNLEEVLKKESPSFSSNLHIGIGHTRWATHGRPSETNAHPHQVGKVLSLIHI